MLLVHMQDMCGACIGHSNVWDKIVEYPLSISAVLTVGHTQAGGIRMIKLFNGYRCSHLHITWPM